MKDTIELKGMRFFAYHGCLEQERTEGNTFDVSLVCFTDLTAASKSDDLEDTVNYADLFDIVKQEMAVPSNLLEHVAGRIASRIKASCPRINSGTVTIAKQNPPFDLSPVEGCIVKSAGEATITLNF